MTKKQRSELAKSLSEICGGQLSELANSPEVIAKAIKQQSEGKSDA